ncbi:MAG TPA: hypothetical protein ENK19_03205, partial [Acidobacteria bacterium]|nr:hypothetical protein [Acidobacteriota bacterium]
MRRAIVLAVALTAACASAPRIDYYTLGAEAAGHAGPAVNVAVQRFRTTEALARRGIMVSLS